MEAATKLGLPWRLLREKLAPPDPDTPATDVNYKKTLEMLETDLIVSLHLISGVLYLIYSFLIFTENCTCRINICSRFFV